MRSNETRQSAVACSDAIKKRLMRSDVRKDTEGRSSETHTIIIDSFKADSQEAGTTWHHHQFTFTTSTLACNSMMENSVKNGFLNLQFMSACLKSKLSTISKGFTLMPNNLNSMAVYGSSTCFHTEWLKIAFWLFQRYNLPKLFESGSIFADFMRPTWFENAFGTDWTYLYPSLYISNLFFNQQKQLR